MPRPHARPLSPDALMVNKRRFAPVMPSGYHAETQGHRVICFFHREGIVENSYLYFIYIIYIYYNIYI